MKYFFPVKDKSSRQNYLKINTLKKLPAMKEFNNKLQVFPLFLTLVMPIFTIGLPEKKLSAFYYMCN